MRSNILSKLIFCKLCEILYVAKTKLVAAFAQLLLKKTPKYER